MNLHDLDDFTISYLETALWSSTDENGDPLDDNYGIEDIAPATLAEMVADCAAFQADHAADIAEREEQAGRDFWLTRNHHGAGFWDGDWDEEVGRRLTDASDHYGSVDLYPGDDGLLYA